LICILISLLGAAIAEVNPVTVVRLLEVSATLTQEADPGSDSSKNVQLSMIEVANKSMYSLGQSIQISSSAATAYETVLNMKS